MSVTHTVQDSIRKKEKYFLNLHCSKARWIPPRSRFTKKPIPQLSSTHSAPETNCLKSILPQRTQPPIYFIPVLKIDCNCILTLGVWPRGRTVMQFENDLRASRRGCELDRALLSCTDGILQGQQWRVPGIQVLRQMLILITDCKTMSHLNRGSSLLMKDSPLRECRVVSKLSTREVRNRNA